MRKLAVVLSASFVMLAATGCTVFIPGGMGRQVAENVKTLNEPGVETIWYTQYTFLGFYERYQVILKNE